MLWRNSRQEEKAADVICVHELTVCKVSLALAPINHSHVVIVPDKSILYSSCALCHCCNSPGKHNTSISTIQAWQRNHLKWGTRYLQAQFLVFLLCGLPFRHPPQAVYFPLTHSGKLFPLEENAFRHAFASQRGFIFSPLVSPREYFPIYESFKIYDSASRVILKNEHATSILIMDIAIFNVKLSVIYGLL